MRQIKYPVATKGYLSYYGSAASIRPSEPDVPPQKTWAMGKETTMAAIHPEDRAIGYAPTNRSTEHKLHPAVGLAVGFGFIVGVATLVHVVFNSLV